jgi:hypothetical protein
MRTSILAALILASSACLSDRELREDRLAYRVELWRAANPGASLDAKTLAELDSEAKREVDEEIEAEKRAVAEKLAGGAASALSGNYLGGGLLALGAILTYFGVGRQKKASEKPPNTTPPPGGGLAEKDPAKGG